MVLQWAIAFTPHSSRMSRSSEDLREADRGQRRYEEDALGCRAQRVAPLRCDPVVLGPLQLCKRGACARNYRVRARSRSNSRKSRFFFRSSSCRCRSRISLATAVVPPAATAATPAISKTPVASDAPSARVLAATVGVARTSVLVAPTSSRDWRSSSSAGSTRR